ncbi:hypothetical protein KUCAC02_007457, partial [Chaenocephalus aceratus]
MCHLTSVVPERHGDALLPQQGVWQRRNDEGGAEILAIVSSCSQTSPDMATRA